MEPSTKPACSCNKNIFEIRDFLPEKVWEVVMECLHCKIPLHRVALSKQIAREMQKQMDMDKIEDYLEEVKLDRARSLLSKMTEETEEIEKTIKTRRWYMNIYSDGNLSVKHMDFNDDFVVGPNHSNSFFIENLKKTHLIFRMLESGVLVCFETETDSPSSMFNIQNQATLERGLIFNLGKTILWILETDDNQCIIKTEFENKQKEEKIKRGQVYILRRTQYKYTADISMSHEHAKIFYSEVEHLWKLEDSQSSNNTEQFFHTAFSLSSGQTSPFYQVILDNSILFGNSIININLI